MKFKSLIFITIILIFIPICCFADDENPNDELNFETLDLEVSEDLSNSPSINARYAVVFDRASKTILFGKNENEKCKMASTTKIMTAIVVLENCTNLNDIVTVSKKAARHRWF